MIEQMIDGYKGAFVEESGKSESSPETIDKTATRRTWKALPRNELKTPSRPTTGWLPASLTQRIRQVE
jgi:hypothetical protein